MNKIIENSRYLVLVAVFALLITFAFSLFWGVVKAFDTWMVIISSTGHSSEITLLLIKVVDGFLIALVLYLLAASIYNMMIGNLNIPNNLVASSLSELKTKLSSMMVLVIAIRFVEFMFDNETDSLNLLYLALATALVSGALIAFSSFNARKGDH